MQIRDCIQDTLNPLGVAVSLKPSTMYGDAWRSETNSVTTTSAFTGCFWKITARARSLSTWSELSCTDEQQEKKSSFFTVICKGLPACGNRYDVVLQHNVDKELILRFELFFRKQAWFCLYFPFQSLYWHYPPEFFLIWSLRSGEVQTYISYVVILTFISYFAGLAAFLFGRYLHNTRVYIYLRDRYLKKSEILLQDTTYWSWWQHSHLFFFRSGHAGRLGNYPVGNILLVAFTFVKFAVTAYVLGSEYDITFNCNML